MEYRQLGTSDMNVSVIAFGAWQLGDLDYWGDDDQADAEAAVKTALDHGVNLYDTAEMYGQGRSEAVLGKALGERRKDIYIATKFWPDVETRDDITARCHRSLDFLKTDYIDLYQVHWPLHTMAAEDAVAELLELQSQGKIRHIGLSNYGVDQLNDWIQHASAVSNQMAYNLLFRAIEYGVVPLCQHHTIGILTYMPVMQGMLAGRYDSPGAMPKTRRRTRHFAGHREGVLHNGPGLEDLTFETIGKIKQIAHDHNVDMAALAIAWAYQQPGITSAIIGARKPDQLERNLKAAHITLDPGALQALYDATRPLKEALGPNPDMWKPGEESRIH